MFVPKTVRWDTDLAHSFLHCDQYLKGPTPDRATLQTEVLNRAVAWASGHEPFFLRAPTIRRVATRFGSSNVHGTDLDVKFTAESWATLSALVGVLGKIGETHLAEYALTAYLRELKFKRDYPDTEKRPVVELEQEV